MSSNKGLFKAFLHGLRPFWTSTIIVSELYLACGDSSLCIFWLCYTCTMYIN